MNSVTYGGGEGGPGFFAGPLDLGHKHTGLPSLGVGGGGL